MENRGEDRKDFARRSFRKNDGERGEGRRQEHSENFRPRRFERGDDERRDGRRDFRKDGYKPRSDRTPSRRGDLGAILDLDNDILHLVMRRAQMLARLRRGGRLAPETEKTLRTAWESKAARLARDNRLSRDLFMLLQTIEPLTRMEEETEVMPISLFPGMRIRSGYIRASITVGLPIHFAYSAWLNFI